MPFNVLQCILNTKRLMSLALWANTKETRSIIMIMLMFLEHLLKCILNTKRLMSLALWANTKEARSIIMIMLMFLEYLLKIFERSQNFQKLIPVYLKVSHSLKFTENYLQFLEDFHGSF